MPIATKDEFMDLFHKHYKGDTTQREAYQRAESEHMDLFGSERYNGWEVFRVIKYRHDHR